MFFSTYVLTKKGPLAKVWLAAHWDRRLTRHEVKVVDLRQTILHIVRPVVPIALRTSGELLVGVVRIYALKVRHLLKEATEATLFLRVTTMATKGAKASLAGQHRTTSIDGVLVAPKGDVEAVTFDWGTEAGGLQGTATDAAEALGEGRFDAIADLLGHGRRIEGPEVGKEEALLASAWYTVQPASQAVEEPHHPQDSQHDYDEIAKMRADLMAFGERASGSASTSKSKSSLSSMEKGRGSAAVGDIGMLFPAVGDGLDIGLPLPDGLPADFSRLAEGGNGLAEVMPADPFLLPDEMMMTAAEEEAAAAAQRTRPSRKTRHVNVLDLASTTLSREAFEKCMADRSDTLHGEPRRGPYDAQEERDRFVVNGATAAAAAAATHPAHLALDAAPLFGVFSPPLRSAYAMALGKSVEEVFTEAARVAQEAEAAAAAQRSVVRSGSAAFYGHDGEAPTTAAGAGLEDDSNALGEVHGQVMEGRKRSRPDEAEEAEEAAAGTGLSASVQRTLERIRSELASRATASGRKKAKTETAALVGTRCTLSDVCRGLRRRDAARTFVDVLALASHQYIHAHEIASGTAENTEVQLTLNAAAVQLLSAA